MNFLKYLFVLVVLVSASLVVAQQPQSQTTTPPQDTRPSFPPDTAAPEPSQNAGQRHPQSAVTLDEARSLILQKLQAEPGLSSREINVEVKNDMIVLSGSVPTQTDRAVTQRIAQSNAGNKRVENRLVISTEDYISKPRERR